MKDFRFGTWNRTTGRFERPAVIPNFGAIGPNGLTFTRSVKNPNSVLSRVVKFINDFETNNGVSPRKIDILRGVWDFDNLVFPWGKPSARGYHTTMFRIAVAAGFLRHYRDGNTVRWTTGTRVFRGHKLGLPVWSFIRHDDEIPTTK